uniref:Putative secreted protein n=1 Tax=Ixodes ricinus TaxID=34613 RepID=A0A147BEF5_IXORI
MWKLGSLACTSVSLAIMAKMSAVSTNSKFCLSRNPTMAAHFSTLVALAAHLTSANRRTKSCLVLLANCTISILRSTSVLRGNNSASTVSSWYVLCRMKSMSLPRGMLPAPGEVLAICMAIASNDLHCYRSACDVTGQSWAQYGQNRKYTGFPATKDATHSNDTKMRHRSYRIFENK